MRLREHTEERLNREWDELYERMKSILRNYGEDAFKGGDYFLIDHNYGRYEHQVEMHQLHMLRPEIIQSLQALLIDYPDWEIEISVSVPEEDISIDPGEGPGLAAAKKATYVAHYDREGTASAWHFLTGRKDAIDGLATAVGFSYAYDEKTDQYAHAAGLAILTPDGRLARYLFGLDFAPRDLRMAIVEANDRTIGTSARLRGSWYAAAPDARFDQLVTRYRARYGKIPYRLGSLGYDAVLLTVRAARSWQVGRPFPQGVLTDKDGFAGVDGIFRFARNGVAERSLEVREVTAAGTKIVSPAATAFPD